MVPLSLVVCSLLALAVATDVLQCPDERFDNLNDNVKLTPCKRSPCRLKKGTNTHIEMIFTPDSDMKDVINHVEATLFGVAVPFLGTDGTSICDKLETETGEKTSCPLQAGTKYVYKDSFPIHAFYPSIDAIVQWALVNEKKTIMCFRMPAKIVS